MTRECPLCAKSRHRDVVVNGAWRLVRCVECGLYYRDPPPSEVRHRQVHQRFPKVGAEVPRVPPARPERRPLPDPLARKTVFTVALIGPDGAGKTTIGRELEQTSGLPIRVSTTRS